jgi:diguanylate cyclase
MKYSETQERSGEYLRGALQQMAKHSAGLHPITFAVWYEYVSGANAALNSELDAIVGAGRKLDEESTRRLYDTYVAALDEDSAARLSTSIRQLLVDIEASTAQTGGEAARFGNELQLWNRALQQAPASPVLTERMDLIARQTQQMQASVSTLQQRLDSSQREIGELREELSRVREVAMIDGLTGLLNRTAFDRRLVALVAEEAGDASPLLCLAMMDIDHFKEVNDNFGHVFGDHVLVAIADALKATVKGRDAAARYGGEEFALLLPNTPLQGARVVAEQVRDAIGRKRVRRGDKTVANITVSVGVAAYSPGEPIASFIERADAALYRSKRDGRNRVTVAGPATAE